MMLQISRDAGDFHPGPRVKHSTGQVQVRCGLPGFGRSEDAQLCRGLQNRGTQGRGKPDRGPSSRVLGDEYRGVRFRLACLSHQSSQRSIGDNLSTQTVRKETFGDSRRQVSSPQIRADCGVFLGRRTPRPVGSLLEMSFLKRLADIGERIVAIVTHVCVLMCSGLGRGKASVETTKNDTSQNLQYIRRIRRGADTSWIRFEVAVAVWPTSRLCDGRDWSLAPGQAPPQVSGRACQSMNDCTPRPPRKSQCVQRAIALSV